MRAPNPSNPGVDYANFDASSGKASRIPGCLKRYVAPQIYAILMGTGRKNLALPAAA